MQAPPRSSSRLRKRAGQAMMANSTTDSPLVPSYPSLTVPINPSSHSGNPSLQSRASLIRP